MDRWDGEVPYTDGTVQPLHNLTLERMVVWLRRMAQGAARAQNGERATAAPEPTRGSSSRTSTGPPDPAMSPVRPEAGWGPRG